VASLRERDEVEAAAAELRHRTRRRIEFASRDELDRVDGEDGRAQFPRVLEDPVEERVGVE